MFNVLLYCPCARLLFPETVDVPAAGLRFIWDWRESGAVEPGVCNVNHSNNNTKI